LTIPFNIPTKIKIFYLTDLQRLENHLIAMSPKRNSSDDSERFGKHKEAFLAKFRNADNLFADFESYVLKCSTDWIAMRQKENGDNQSIIDLPFAFVCQSSGYGKTRFMHEFGKRHITVFVCLRDVKKNWDCFPGRSSITSFFMTVFETNEPGCSSKIDDFLIAIIDRALDQVEIIRRALGEDEKNNELLIAVEFEKLQPWSEYRLNKTLYTSNGNDVDDKIAELRTRFAQVMRCEEPDGSLSVMSLTIALDEAQELIKAVNSTSGCSLFSLLKQSAYNVLPGMRVAFAFTSTCVDLFNPYSLENRSSEKSRVENGRGAVYPPYCRLVTVDFVTNKPYVKLLEGFARAFDQEKVIKSTLSLLLKSHLKNSVLLAQLRLRCLLEVFNCFLSRFFFKENRFRESSQVVFFQNLIS
jgi:hypothetical protein